MAEMRLAANSSAALELRREDGDSIFPKTQHVVMRKQDSAVSSMALEEVFK